ncbi:hypothetical protein MHYP_G00176130 [Metynnis hypsauchen]
MSICLSAGISSSHCDSTDTPPRCPSPNEHVAIANRPPAGLCMRLIDMSPLLSRQRSIRRTHFLLWLICLITATLQTSLFIINEGKITVSPSLTTKRNGCLYS